MNTSEIASFIVATTILCLNVSSVLFLCYLTCKKYNTKTYTEIDPI